MGKERLVGLGLLALGLAAIVVVGLGSRLASHISPVGFAESNQYRLTFHDEFNGSALNADVWNACYEWYDQAHQGCTNYGNNESEWYDASQVKVSNGVLTLSSQKDTRQGGDRNGNAKDYAYISGMVSSGRQTKTSTAKWQGTYGYYEAKMTVPAGNALWPAFWLLPTNHQWPPEIDIMELLGGKPNQILNTYFWKNDSGGTAKDSTAYTGRTSYAKGWHIYGVDWRKNSIDWYIDGKKVKSASGPNIPSEPMQIIFNLAVGGNLPGSPDSTTPDKAQVRVDYVRVFSNSP